MKPSSVLGGFFILSLFCPIYIVHNREIIRVKNNKGVCNMFNTQGYRPYPYPQYATPQFLQQPYQQPQQMGATPQMQGQMQPAPAYEIPIQDVRFVTGEEARAYIVMPNSKALLIDKQSGIAHLKTADNLGQSQTAFFKFEAVNADGTPIKPQEAAPKFDPEEFGKKFATIEQLQNVIDQFNEIKRVLEARKPAPQAQPQTPKIQGGAV